VDQRLRETWPVELMPIAWAAVGVRSICLPAANGPRSLMRTTTHPLWQTLTRDSWSVAINTHRGACRSGLRYGMQILNGQVVNAAGGAADVRGSVSPGGAVRVSVQSGGQWASGSGHLGVAIGGGVWRGQGNAGACSGTWSAQRMTSQVVAAQTPPVATVFDSFFGRAAGVGGEDHTAQHGRQRHLCRGWGPYRFPPNRTGAVR